MMKIITKAIALLIAFSTATLAQEKGSFTDSRDKKKYKTVKIGEQVWMAENLNYADKASLCYGEGISTVPYLVKDRDKNQMVTLSKAEIQANCAKYGRLYNWETAIKACPKGWHLPRKAEAEKLLFLADSTYKTNIYNNTAGKHLKAKSGWKNMPGEPANGTDSFGFSALPGGYRERLFMYAGGKGGWWVNNSLEPAAIVIGGVNGGEEIAELRGYNELYSFSIRCIQGDDEALAKAEAEEKAKLKAEAEAKVAKEKAEAEAKAAKEKAEAEAYAKAYVKANSGTFTDPRDKKTYKTIKIGGQVWMAENLNYEENSKCRDNKPENCAKDGRYYTLYTAERSCPQSWHLPNNAEWDKLLRFADGTSGDKSPYTSKTAGKFLKSASGWPPARLRDGGEISGNGLDKFGFSAMPSVGGNSGSWWSSTKEDNSYAYIYQMTTSDITGSTTKRTDEYYNVRCVKD
jgi:uncharacterized protein (TIGR02145 family)